MYQVSKIQLLSLALVLILILFLAIPLLSFPLLLVLTLIPSPMLLPPSPHRKDRGRLEWYQMLAHSIGHRPPGLD